MEIYKKEKNTKKKTRKKTDDDMPRIGKMTVLPIVYISTNLKISFLTRNLRPRRHVMGV